MIKTLAICEAVLLVLITSVLVILIIKWEKRLKDNKKMNLGFKDYYEVVSRWILLKNRNLDAKDYFLHYGYRHIAIYGAGPLGEMLFNELAGSEIFVEYVVDKSKTKFDLTDGGKIISPQQIGQQKQVDAIIITPLLYQKEILDVLCGIDITEDTVFILFDEIVNYFFHKGT